jgi:hypothetical protein
MEQADRISMDTAATTDAMSLVAATGERIASGWRAVSSELNGLVGQLGQRELGAAFLDSYQPSATETASIVEQSCQVPGRFAEVGNQCVAEYESADNHSRDIFNFVNATAPPASSRFS